MIEIKKKKTKSGSVNGMKAEILYGFFYKQRRSKSVKEELDSQIGRRDRPFELLLS